MRFALFLLKAIIAVPVAAAAVPTTDTVKRAIPAIISGTPIGFASGATGGGNATPVHPSTIQQLITYLTSDDPQNIVISGELDFTGSEGTQKAGACDAYSCTTSEGGQALLNTLGGCGTQPTYDVTVDSAAYTAINVQSNKSLVGQDGATLIGKGLRFQGASNIIIQNIKITNLNPQYVWGGDALSFSDSRDIWIDHVTTSSLGRQHYSFGTGSSLGITISNSFIDGQTAYSATCDGHTYWGLELVGSGDQITFYKNYIYYTSGRTPALSGNTLFHAVNNVWSSNSGHLIEGDSDGKGLYEGNYFLDVPVVVVSGFSGRLMSSNADHVTECAAYLGRDCVSNSFSNSGSFSRDDNTFLNLFEGKADIVGADPESAIQNTVPLSAGNTL
ncbi:polysaccharide lyase family 1 protein [Xylaria sp. CBS 124048]|nr:polysaccharide lyase family 1 protein [Xylaria sp. CBS 124048]